MTDRPVEEAAVVIIGGGVIGLSLAYHLGVLGVTDVVLLERHTLTSGTSWHAAGIVGPLRSSLNLTRLSVYATELLPRLEAETGQATGYRRTGGLWLAQTPERLAELRRIESMGAMTGISAAIVGPEECARRFPQLAVGDLAGALWVEEDGQTNPVETCMAYAKGARARGVRIREHAPVTAIRLAHGAVHSVETADGTQIRCKTVVNCAGAWARAVGELAGVRLPLQAVEHMYVVTLPVPDLPSPCPIVRDLDAGIYVKEDAGKLVIGGFEHNAKVWMPDAAGPDGPFLEFPEDWAQFEPFMSAALRRIPALESVGIRHFMNGPESFTPDTRQLLGEVPGVRGFYIGAGFNSIGIVSSAGAGRVLAEWVSRGEPPSDLWDVDVARFDPSAASRRFLANRTPESVANQFDMHWPYRQPRTGRDVRRGVLHDAFADQGAVFGAPTGWERPLWYALDASERTLVPTYGPQSWWSAAAREAEALSTRAGLIELTPFTKLLVAGPDAARVLQRACAGDVDRPPGSILYTPMLNARGGIEADVTVTRLEEDRFLVVSGAATRVRDFGHLSRAVERHDRATVTDVSSAYAVLGLMGPSAREILARVTDEDLATARFGFGTSKEIELGSAIVRASRVSYVGEFGYELYIPVEYAAHVHTELCAAGRDLQLAHIGHWCVDACRLEKGYRHWGHDIGPDDTPLEAGLASMVAWNKPDDFTGRAALVEQRLRGPGRRLLHFAVRDGAPLLMHDEPIYRNGRLIGRTSSGARGFRVGRSICLAWIDCEPGTTPADLRKGAYEVGVDGARHGLEPLARVPYDPDGTRLRG